MNMSSRTKFTTAFLSCLVTSSAVLAEQAPGTRSVEKVTLGQVTSTSMTFAPIFAAESLGFFADEGIELEHLNFQGGSVLQPQIANKEVTFGFTAVESIIISHQPGRDALPLVFFYNGARESIWETVVLDDSPIKTPADLTGKTIGIGATTNANVPLTRAMLTDLGMELGQDYSFMPIGVGAPAFRAMINKDVDAYNTFDSNIATFETTGTTLRKLDVPENYRALFSNGFVAHKDTLVDKQHLVKGFGRALTKGILVCEANPVYCVDNFWEKFPSQKPEASSPEEALNKGLHVLNARMSKYTYFPEGQKREFGIYDEKGWLAYLDILYDGGELASKDIDVKQLYSNEFVADYNDFSIEELTTMAKSLK